MSSSYPATGLAGSGASQGAPERQEFARRVADYEKLSAILWLILGIIQILCVVTIIAGVWNVFAAVTRFRIEKQIRALDPGVPAAYEGMAGLIIIGLINLLFGAVLGVVFVIFDFYIRDQVLSHRGYFTGSPAIEPSFAQPVQPDMTDVDRLERLAALRASGALSEEEFQREKGKVLGG